MRQTIILLIILLFSYSSVSASVWSALLKCITDPCNCGDSNSVKYETWNGYTYNRGKKNHACPPWGKNSGRENNTCLVREKNADDTLAPGFPGTFIGYYENLCGEATPESTYFDPKIRVRGQQCNALGCWSTDTTLNWDGECVTLLGGYVFPLHRMCARIALPEDKEKNTPADLNYHRGKHLNSEGAVEYDELIEDSNGDFIEFEPPKLCLYRDPSFFSTDSGFDVMDLNPNRQPFHKTQEVHIVVKVIQFFVKASGDLSQTFIGLFESLMDALGGDTDGKNLAARLLKTILSGFSKIIAWVGDKIVGLLDEVGQINRAVDDTLYGCINIPLGPMPPPYCEHVTPFSQIATTQKICTKDDNGIVSPSHSDNQCVVSKMNNNYIHNTARVGYDLLLPLCNNGEDPMTNDACVEIKNLGIFSASDLHNFTNSLDLLQHCNDAQNGAPCVNTMLSCTGCEDGFRIIYGEKIGEKIDPRSYFDHNIKDCSTNSLSPTCQAIFGVNAGGYKDVALEFPSIQTDSDQLSLVNYFNLTDKDGENSSFYAVIFRYPTFNNHYSFMQDPRQMCVFSDEYMVGCINRAPPPLIKVYDCDNSPANITCSSEYLSPKFIASYSINGNSTSSLIEPDTINGSSQQSDVNLAGSMLSSFVTNKEYDVIPFTGPNAPNTLSLFGKYVDDILPIIDGDVNDDAIYEGGLEYVNGKYYRGGQYACLSGGNDLDNNNMYVLTKLLNSDVVECKRFLNDYRNLKVCSTNEESECDIVGYIDKINGGNINIRSCDGYSKCYDGGVELCKISQNFVDRIDPPASDGKILSKDQYYDLSGSSVYPNAPIGMSMNYDPNKYALRYKTSIELGLCVDIPQPTCKEENNYSKENGYAYWAATSVGEEAQGICKEGWHLETIYDLGVDVETIKMGWIEFEIEKERTEEIKFKRRCVFSKDYTPVFENLYTIVSNSEENPYTKGKTEYPCPSWQDGLFGDEAKCNWFFITEQSQETLDEHNLYLCAPEKVGDIIFKRGKCDPNYRFVAFGDQPLEENLYTKGKTEHICPSWKDGLFGDEAECTWFFVSYKPSQEILDENNLYICVPEKVGDIIFKRGKCDPLYSIISSGELTSYREYPAKCVKD